MTVFSLSNATRLLLVGGLFAFVFVNVKSCRSPATGWESYATGTLSRLTALEAPPAQPGGRFVNASGAEMRLSDYRGEKVLLNVWATWCPPCVVELPMLEAVAKTREDIRVVTVAFDAPEKVEAFLDREGFDIPRWTDPGYSLTGKLATPEMSQVGLPVTVFYNESGREVARVLGEVNWTAPEATAFLDAIAAR